jgi:ribokinase
MPDQQRPGGRLRPQVVVVGSINVDFVVSAERLPARGETVVGGRLERSGGGKGANQAVAAARTGAAVSLVGSVGDDDLGADALDALRAEGIDVTGVDRVPGTPTGVAVIVVDREGDNQIAVASGANHALSGERVSAALGELGRGPGCVLVSFELTDDVVGAAADAARTAGRTLIVNPAPARALDPALCRLAPILTPNEREAAGLSGAGDPEEAGRRLAAQTGAPVVITLGAGGALVVEGTRAERVAAPAARVVDTTGAGDTFSGVLAAELAAGRTLRAGAGVAVAAASLSVTVAGARGGMPHREALDAAVGRAPGPA